MLSEISQAEKGKYCMVSLTCRILISQNHRNRIEWWLLGAGEGGNGEGLVE